MSYFLHCQVVCQKSQGQTHEKAIFTIHPVVFYDTIRHYTLIFLLRNMVNTQLFSLEIVLNVFCWLLMQCSFSSSYCFWICVHISYFVALNNQNSLYSLQNCIHSSFRMTIINCIVLNWIVWRTPTQIETCKQMVTGICLWLISISLGVKTQLFLGSPSFFLPEKTYITPREICINYKFWRGRSTKTKNQSLFF